MRFLNTALGLKDSVDENGARCRLACFSRAEAFDKGKEDAWFDAYNAARTRTQNARFGTGDEAIYSDGATVAKKE